MIDRPKRKIFEGETWLNRQAMRPLAQELLLLIWETNITPNIVSITRILLLLPLGSLLMHSGIFSIICAIILFIFMEVLDHLDGMLARAKGLSSVRGQFLEVISDEFSASPNFILGFVIVIASWDLSLFFFFVLSISAERMFLFMKYNATAETKHIVEITHENETTEPVGNLIMLIKSSMRFCFIWKPLLLLLCNLISVIFQSPIILMLYFLFIATIWVLMTATHLRNTWRAI